MKNKYSINTVHICPFIFLSGINVVPNLNYPRRLCVIDKEEGFAIDINTELKYDYIETPSRLYIGSMIDKIKDDRRVAILSNFGPENIHLKYESGLKIIEQLESGRKFVNGNDVYNNEQYLEYLNQESIENQENNKKLKKVRKKK